MIQTEFTRLLLGHDLRKLRNTRRVIEAVTDQKSFDELFSLLFHHERPLVMRAADAVEKITATNRLYLSPHKHQLLSVLRGADLKELKWHLAQLLPRLELTKHEIEDVWHRLTYWALNRNESKIVRVNALQGLFDLARIAPALQKDFHQTLHVVEQEPIPSLQARIRKLKKAEDV
jgi:hypothetical protein